MAVIPARSGSKRLPGKNILPLGGKPLIAWSIEAAQAASRIDRIVVSTDAEEIAAVAVRHGAEVPFLRPAEISGDRTSDMPVLAHAAEWFRQATGRAPDLLVLLRPTTPLRAPDLIDRCIDRLFELDADSVRSVRPVGHSHPYWMLQCDEQGWARPFLDGKSVDEYYQSQMLPPLYKHDGYCDVVRTRNLPIPCPPDATLKGLYGRRVATVINDVGYYVNIDSLADFRLAEYFVSNVSHG